MAAGRGLVLLGTNPAEVVRGMARRGRQLGSAVMLLNAHNRSSGARTKKKTNHFLCV
jgi:hypothetical protein